MIFYGDDLMAIGFHFDDIEAAAFGYTIAGDEYEGQILIPIDKKAPIGAPYHEDDEKEIETPPIGAPYHD